MTPDGVFVKPWALEDELRVHREVQDLLDLNMCAAALLAGKLRAVDKVMSVASRQRGGSSFVTLTLKGLRY